MIDISKLPAPKIIEELGYEVILESYRAKLMDLLPDWTAADLESDPANKILEVSAYREMLLRQRINEAVRAVMVAFASGSDLDHLAAFYPEERLPGAKATFAAKLALSAALDIDVIVPVGYQVIAKNGETLAALMSNVTIPAGEIAADAIFEIQTPGGSVANDLKLTWDAITPLPFVVRVEQTEASHGGSDDETDAAFRVRIPQALERYSVAGPYGAYMYWAISADARVKDVKVFSPEPGIVSIVLLSADGDGTADEAMLQRVTETVTDDKVRPLTDNVEIFSAQIVPYSLELELELYPGVAGQAIITEATARAEVKAAALHKIDMDIPRSAFIAAAHVEGVKRVVVVSPGADIHIDRTQAAYCSAVTVTAKVADEL